MKQQRQKTAAFSPLHPENSSEARNFGISSFFFLIFFQCKISDLWIRHHVPPWRTAAPRLERHEDVVIAPLPTSEAYMTRHSPITSRQS